MERKKHNSGIALVMVLGVLSVMVIMAVAFAISMRTERVASGNYADSVRARQLVHVAIARAMADIQNNLYLPDRIVVGREPVNPKITVMGVGTWELNDWAVFETSGTLPSAITANQPYQISYSDGTNVLLAGVSLSMSTEGTFPGTVVTSETFTIDIDGLKTSGMRHYYRGTPVYRTGFLNTDYVIPINYNHIKLADSYENALQGVAQIIGAPGPGTLNLKPIHYMIPVHTIKSTHLAVKTIELDQPCKFKTGDAVTYYSPSAPPVGQIYYVRVVENDVIQLAESFNKAVLGDCLNVAAFNQNGYLKKRGFLAPPWSGYASYTTNTLQSIAAKYELVIFDTALNQVIVGNRYRSGDCIAFTKTASPNLPSPLEEKQPYYVISVGADKIKLATTIDNALASPPVSIPLSGGSGSYRLYLTILSGEVTNYIPMSLYSGIATAACAAVSNTYVDVSSAVSTNENILFGKYRYLVADCSGLLDANFVGGGTRNQGINPSEIQLANLPESAGSLPGNRTSYIRYETLYELADNLNYHPVNLFVYSYSQPEQWDSNLINLQLPINIGGNLVQLQNQMTAITNALWLAGVTSIVQAGIIYSNLIDYVDDDLIPSNFVYCVENVPMINEIVFESLDDTNGILNSIKVELWYPFVSTPGVFRLSVSFSVDDGQGPQNLTSNITITAGGMTVLPFGRYATATNPAYTFQLTNIVVETATGQEVDKITLGIPVSQPVARMNKVSKQVNDPRFNSNIADTNEWQTLPDTLLGTNANTSQHWINNPNFDTDSEMFVANIQLLSVAELGCLAFEPWRTVKLYGPNRCRVLDVFAIATNPACWFATNNWNHGQINLNTKSLDVMKAWFQGMSVDKYPGQTMPIPHPLTSVEAQTVAQLIVDQAGSYTNLSDLGRVLTTFPVGTSELEKEAYFRNTCGLFNVHQNVFTILIEAQVASGGNIPRNPVKQRAAVIVWRDPFTGEMVKRNIVWLGD